MSLWDAQTGQFVRRYEGHVALVNALSFSSDGDRILMGCDDRSARLWDLATAREISRFPATDKAPTSAVALLPDGTQALTATTYESVRVTDSNSGKLLRSFPVKFLRAVVPTADARGVFVGESDGMVEYVRLLNLESGQALQRFPGRLQGPWQLSADGTRLVTQPPQQGVTVWDVGTGKPLSLHPAPGPVVAALSPSGHSLLLGGSDGVLSLRVAVPKGLHDASAVQRVGELKGTRMLTFTPDEKGVLAVASSRARLLDIASGKEIFAFDGYPHSIMAAVISPDGKAPVADQPRPFRSPLRPLEREGSLPFRLRPQWLPGDHTGQLLCCLTRPLTGICFRVGNRVFPFDQFDLRYNRPEVVLDRIGLAPAETVAAYREAYRSKRLRRLASPKPASPTRRNCPRWPLCRHRSRPPNTA